MMVEMRTLDIRKHEMTAQLNSTAMIRDVTSITRLFGNTPLYGFGMM